MTIEEMRERKQELGYSYKRIAELSGLPVETVQMVLGGLIKSPEYEVLKMLEEVLEAKEDYEYSDELKDEVTAYQFKKQQGEYTIEDYFALPDDQRVELIDSVIYDMSAPTTGHQGISGEIYSVFHNYIHSLQIKSQG